MELLLMSGLSSGRGSDENTLKWNTLKFDGTIAGRLLVPPTVSLSR